MEELKNSLGIPFVTRSGSWSDTAPLPLTEHLEEQMEAVDFDYTSMERERKKDLASLLALESLTGPV